MPPGHVRFPFCFFCFLSVFLLAVPGERGEAEARKRKAERRNLTRKKKTKKTLTFPSFSLSSCFFLSPFFRHWAGGAIGYFPTYVLGAIAAAQLDETARAELKSKGLDFDKEVSSGKEGFKKLREWLEAKVHSRGSLPESLDALMVEATG